MVFTLVHEVGNRTRWRTDGTMSLASAKLLADELERVPGVTGLRVNPRTGSVVVTVADWEARGRVAAYFASLEKSPLITRVDTTAARRALSAFRSIFSRAFRDEARAVRARPPGRAT